MGAVPGRQPFAELLRSARLAAGMTQEDLAAGSGLSIRAISDLERDRARRPYFRTVRLLADALGIPESARAELLAAARCGQRGGPPQDPVRADRDAAEAHGIDPGRGAGGLVAPRQLPGVTAHFVGRERELAMLNGLPGQAMQSSAAAVVISLIDGAAGVGKTALAVLFAHRAAGRFPDGQLWVDLRGFDPHRSPLTSAEALSQLLRSLGADPRPVPPDLDGQAGLYRSLVAGKRLLVVLDNAATAAQVQPLLPGSGSCLVVVTSRDQLGGLVARHGARRLTLDVLAPGESTALLASIAGPDLVAAEPGASAELARLCGYLPLALRIAAERAAACPHLSLADLAAELAVEEDRLDLLAEDATTAVRAAFWWSYRALPPAAARMFRLLSLHSGPDISTLTAAALAGVTPSRARLLLKALAGMHLLAATGKHRYRLHDLLRVYAAERGYAEETRDDRAAAARRAHDWYLHAAYAAGGVLRPQAVRMSIDPPSGPCVLPPLGSHRQAIAWCEAERDNLVASVSHAAGLGDHVTAWKLAVALWPFFQLRMYWADWIAICRAGLASARQISDLEGQAATLHGLGIAYCELGRRDDAVECLQQVARIHRRTSDKYHECWALHALGRAYRDFQRPDDATKALQQAMAIVGTLGAPEWEGCLLVDLGAVYRETDRFDEAIDLLRRGLAVGRQTGSRLLEGYALHNLGEAYHRQCRYDEASRYLRQSLAPREELGNRIGEAKTLTSLGDIHRDTGHLASAIEHWREALAILDDLGHPHAADLRDRISHAVGSVSGSSAALSTSVPPGRQARRR